MGVSPSAGDIAAALDSAIEFQATIGGGVVCQSVPGSVEHPAAARGQRETRSRHSGTHRSPVTGCTCSSTIRSGRRVADASCGGSADPGRRMPPVRRWSPSTWLVALREPIAIPRRRAGAVHAPIAAQPLQGWRRPLVPRREGLEQRGGALQHHPTGCGPAAPIQSESRRNGTPSRLSRWIRNRARSAGRSVANRQHHRDVTRCDGDAGASSRTRHVPERGIRGFIMDYGRATKCVLT